MHFFGYGVARTLGKYCFYLNKTSEISFPAADMLPVVVVHGGAGHIPKERAENSTSGVCSAVRLGYLVLQEGGSSMDAVVEAVVQLENSPYFNAGKESLM